MRCCLTDQRASTVTLDRYRPLLILAAGDAARTALCRAVGRPRPPAHERLAHCQGASFPSRHTATALLASELVADAGPAAASAVAGVVGLSRIALRVHWPSDVIGGWLFAYAWLAAVKMARRTCMQRSNTATKARILT
ncbi:phosphatase PAP2 family protein [Streptomyces avermitilis]|uniref:phosphatase PAP2 family protein n=1 Tax=Streptomyces avermitilis TaxID=33903 RepID=UPI0033D1FC23